ncbi:hypothetical protein [Micromonospora sp. NPDC093277]|uniref:hypothetical protein n=1 Tax=Micromonospora sp. NPDC093277 TaxID=3364291 RepID=UPI003807FA16
MDVTIAGYEDLPLIDGGRFLADPLFWPTYLCDTFYHDTSLVTAVFEVDEEDCLNYYRRLTDPEAWPVYRLALRDGQHEIDVISRNVPGAGNTEFVLSRRGGEHPLELAVVGGHELGPGLSWPELGATAAWPGAPFGVVEPDARLLLLLPALGDSDLPADATDTLTTALTKCGAGLRAGELAECLLDEPEEWPQWRRQADGALVSAGPYSRRNPDGPAGHPPADLLEISSALGVG